MASNDPQIAGLSFSDPSVAMRTRDVMRKIAGNTVEAEGTNPQVGRVMSVDIAKLNASVWFPGDDSPEEVGMFPGSIPKDLGDYRGTVEYETSAVGTGALVYVQNWRGKPYITHILSGGEYTLNQQVAGLTHLVFNATTQGTFTGAPVGDIYERHVNIKLVGGSSFTVGKCIWIGPWTGNNDGTMIDGIIELVVTYYVSANVLAQVRKYQFSVSDRMIVDLEGDEGNKPFWMRVLPQTNLGTSPHGELAIDVALVKTAIRAPLEFWIRLVPLDTLADQTTYLMSVKTFGSAFNVGDPKTGRVVAIRKDTVDDLQGFLGFHNAGMGFTERDEYPTYPAGVGFFGDEWSSGSWRSGALRAAKDLQHMWSVTGQWTWGTDNKLFWEGNIIFKGIGPNWNALHTGNIAVPFPGHDLPVFPSSTNGVFRSISGGILLNEGDTLYYGIPPGAGTGGQGNWMNRDDTFFIVDSKTLNASQKNFSVPEWAIPIATRAVTSLGERDEIQICHPTVQKFHMDDRTKYSVGSYTTAHTGIVGSDETETMDLPSFRFKKKTAYEFHLSTSAYSSNTTTAVTWRVRKGTTVAGSEIIQIQRHPMVNTTGAIAFQYRSVIVNDTSSDIVTALVVTGQSNGAAAVTWTRHASAATPSTVMVNELGPSNKYAGRWPALT